LLLGEQSEGGPRRGEGAIQDHFQERGRFQDNFSLIVISYCDFRTIYSQFEDFYILRKSKKFFFSFFFVGLALTFTHSDPNACEFQKFK